MKAQSGECAGRPPRATRAWICRAVRRCHARSAIARRVAHTTAWRALPLPPRNRRRDLGAASCAACADRADGSAQISPCCCQAGSKMSGSRGGSSGRSSASGVGGVLGGGGGGGAACVRKGRRRAWEATSSGPSGAGAAGMPARPSSLLAKRARTKSLLLSLGDGRGGSAYKILPPCTRRECHSPNPASRTDPPR